ncbi:hypothetical protein JCM10914_2231 [Paenibacillus sp. JCM 10914]|nr:hypothetical protein JCM10914_2231 [Paenibacillus sp. JCM 10914]
MTRSSQAAAIQQIRIGIIGTQTIVDKIMKIIETFPSFDPVPLVFQEEDEAPALAEQIGREVEVLFLSDPSSQRKVKELNRIIIRYIMCLSRMRACTKRYLLLSRRGSWLAAYQWIR